MFAKGAYLDDEDDDGILGIILGWVCSLEDTSLIGCSDHHGDSRLESRCNAEYEGKVGMNDDQQARCGLAGMQ